ncbi:MAG TPA: N-acetylmuramidase domain-containing protein [Desulfuromonadaceae bacterium]
MSNLNNFGTTICDLNLRQGCGTTFPIITSLKPNAHLAIVEQAGEWLKVKVQGQEGFVNRKFVRLLEHQLQEGFLIHRPDVLRWSMAADKPLRRPSSSDQNLEIIVAAWNRFGGLVERLADTISIDPSVAMAVVAAESAGNGFQNGRMIIRFENHYFWNLWGKHNQKGFAEHFSYSKTKPWTGQRFRSSVETTWQSFHGSQAAEWMVFNLAFTLDENAALSSLSMGLPQIMGANHGLIGYESAGDMFAAFSQSERTQLIGLFDFIKGPHSLSPAVSALQHMDFTAFAACYNGSGQAAAYGSNLEKFYDLSVLLLNS